MNLKTFFKSKLSTRFFLIFLVYSFAITVFMILIGSFVTVKKGPRMGGPPPMDHIFEVEKEEMEIIAENLADYHYKNRKWNLNNNRNFFIDLDIADNNLFFLERLFLTDSDGRLIAGMNSGEPVFIEVPVTSDGINIGILSLTVPANSPRPPMHNVLKEIGSILFIWVIFSIFVSFIVAKFLSRYFLHPVSQLAAASKKLSRHDFSIRIPDDRHDEIGELAKDFNEMASQLQKYEMMRKQWIADIAHELRTPISILQAEIEAVQDSVRPLDMKSIDRLHSETLYLAKTVNNLHTLSLAESRHLTVNIEKISVPDIVAGSCARFMEKIRSSEISLETVFESDKLFIKGDSYLLRTVFNNLIENSIRYTDSPGKLIISAKSSNEKIIISFEDTAPGVPEELADRIFDRLFRVDSSRSRKHGGSGLGLSTCKIYVELLKGKISASTSKLGGLNITLELPRFINTEEL